MKRACVAIGLDQQGRVIPTMALRQLQREDDSLLCDTCPGELDSPEAAFQSDPSAPSWALRDVLLIVGCISIGIPFFAHVVVTIARAIPT